MTLSNSDIAEKVKDIANSAMAGDDDEEAKAKAIAAATVLLVNLLQNINDIAVNSNRIVDCTG